MVSEKEAACWIEERALSTSKKELIPGDGIFRRKSVPQNISLTLLNMPCRRKKRFLVDGILRVCININMAFGWMVRIIIHFLHPTSARNVKHLFLVY